MFGIFKKIDDFSENSNDSWGIPTDLDFKIDVGVENLDVNLDDDDDKERSNPLVEESSEASNGDIRDKIVMSCPFYAIMKSQATPQHDGSEFTEWKIRIFGPITDIKTYLPLIGTLGALTERDWVTMYVNTPGGRTDTGLQIMDAMDNCKAHITTIATGLCASMGTGIWFAGRTKKADNLAEILYHMSSHGDWDVSTTILERAEIICEHVKKHLLEPALDAGVITAEEFDQIYNQKQDIVIPGVEINRRLGIETGGFDE